MLFYLKEPAEPLGYISAKKAAKPLGITSSRLRLLASQGRVEGAFRDERKGWQFPKSGITVTPGARGPAFGLKRKTPKPATMKKPT